MLEITIVEFNDKSKGASKFFLLYLMQNYHQIVQICIVVDSPYMCETLPQS